MTRCALALSGLLIATCALGCRAPMPSFNVFAPYGPARVQPPCTNSYGAPTKYYQSGSTTVDSGLQLVGASQAVAPDESAQQWTAAGDVTNAVDQATAVMPSSSDLVATPASSTADEAPIRIPQPAESPAITQETVLLASAPNRTSEPVEPARFVPPSEARAMAVVDQSTHPAARGAAASFASTASFTSPPATASPPTRHSDDHGWRSRLARSTTDG